MANYVDDTTVYSKYDEASDLGQQLALSSSELESDLRDTLLRWLVDFNDGKLYCFWFFLAGLTTTLLLM